MEDLAAFFVNEDFDRERVTPAELDHLLAGGWRHFGRHFFRYNLAIYDEEIRFVLPLRIRLSDFRSSKGQQRTMKKNAELSTEIGAVGIDAEVDELFHRHKQRFRHNQPDSLYTFLAANGCDEPCEVLQLSVRRDTELIAASFFDVGAKSMSGIYAVFDPAESDRRLGIFTMLKEIEHAVASGKEFYYQGYCYNGSSFYDYKKQFHGTEVYRWNGEWKSVPRNFVD